MTDLHSPLSTEPPSVVHIGGLTEAELQLRLEQRGVRLNEYAKALLQDTRFSTEVVVREVEVIVSSLSELGLPEGGTYAQVIEQAESRGLGAGPLELAAHLRLQWVRQPEFQNTAETSKHQAPAGAVTVASSAPPDEQEIPWGFYLRRIEGELWLRGYVAWSGHVWGSSDRFAFVRVPSAGSQETPSKQLICRSFFVRPVR